MCNEEEKEMAVISKDIESKLANLKKRAMLRKNNPTLRHHASVEQNEAMLENVREMYKAQVDTIKDNN